MQVLGPHLGGDLKATCAARGFLRTRRVLCGTQPTAPVLPGRSSLSGVECTAHRIGNELPQRKKTSENSPAIVGIADLAKVFHGIDRTTGAASRMSKLAVFRFRVGFPPEHRYVLLHTAVDIASTEKTVDEWTRLRAIPAVALRTPEGGVVLEFRLQTFGGRSAVRRLEGHYRRSSSNLLTEARTVLRLSQVRRTSAKRDGCLPPHFVQRPS